MDVLGDHFVCGVFGVKACAIPNDDVFVIWILHFDLIQEGLRPFHVHAWGLNEDCSALNRINRPIAIAPFVFALPKLVWTQSFERPDSTVIGQ